MSDDINDLRNWKGDQVDCASFLLPPLLSDKKPCIGAPSVVCPSAMLCNLATILITMLGCGSQTPLEGYELLSLAADEYDYVRPVVARRSTPLLLYRLTPTGKLKSARRGATRPAGMVAQYGR